MEPERGEPERGEPERGEPDWQRWTRLEALFHAASALPPAERTAYLRTECAMDEPLLDEVTSMLASEAQVVRSDTDAREHRASGPLHAGNLYGESPYGESWDADKDPLLGSRIGSFLIEARIGEGGMGVVYRAERQEEFTQTVAIKLMAFDHPSQHSTERFLRERDMLAALQHRNIVRLLGGGVTEHGSPYLVMECIRGQRIDVVCDDPSTTVAGVLALMLQVCDAVSYIHRNLVLHRDLKPSNVLVTEDGLVKVLDFGTFKSLSSGSVALTQPGMAALTVRYASPEHIRGLALSTASDVFSLGMMLYRLLIGHLPTGLDDLSIDRYLEALKQEQAHGIAATLTRSRGVNPQLAGDLECILQKALSYEAADRYSDVDALAADLNAARGGHPIAARHSTWVDTGLRMVRRNSLATALILGMTLLLAAGVAEMLHADQQLRVEQLRAERGLSDESHLTHFLVVDYFEELKRIPGSTQAQRQSVSEALTYADRLAAVANLPELQVERAQAYTEMGSLLGNPYENNLDDSAGGIRILRQAVALAQPLSAANPNDPRYRQIYTAAALALGRTYFGTGDARNAARYLTVAVNENRSMLAAVQPDAPTLAEAASTVDALGDVYGQEGATSLLQPEAAMRYYKEAQQLHARGQRLDPACMRCRRGVAIEDWKIGMLTKDQAQAVVIYQAGVDALRQLPPAEQNTARVQRTLALIQQKLGTSELALGRFQDGLKNLRAVHDTVRASAASDATDARAHFDLYALDFNITEYLDLMQDRAWAAQLHHEMLGEVETLLRLNPSNTQWQSHRAEALLRFGRFEVRSGERTAGLADERNAARLFLPMTHAPDVDPEVLRLTAEALTGTGTDHAFAVSCAQRAIAATAQADALQYLTLAEAEQAAGNADAARQTAQKTLLLIGSQRDLVNQEYVRRCSAILHGQASPAAASRHRAAVGA